MLRAYCGGESAVLAQPTANERVRQRIREWCQREGHGSQRRLAKAVSGKFGHEKTDQWISDILNRRADVTLRDLDAICDHMQIPPGELVRRSDRNYEELTMAESRVLRFYRTLPDTVRHHWLQWMEYVFRFHQDFLQQTAEQRAKLTKVARRKETARARAARFPKTGTVDTPIG